MGAASGVECTYDCASSAHTDFASGSCHSSSGPAFLRRRTLSTASTSSNTSNHRLSTSSTPTISTDTRYEPVKPHVLDVSVYERHPFSDFKFQKKVGEGSFATVFKGISVHDKRLKVAVKEINVRTLGKQQLHDLNMEMNILSQLHHESIVKIFAVYSTPDKVFMVTEYMKGGELLTAICKRDRYHERDARRVIYEVASALQYMHARRVIHRDIKPMNLILADGTIESSIKIADFGFATIDCEEIRRPGRFLCGTPGYIAPEVLKFRCYSTKVDMWSLGIVLYVLLSGYMPFPIDEAGEEHVKRGRVVFPPARFARVSHAAKDLILRLLTVDPDARYSASQVLQYPWVQEYAQQIQLSQKHQQSHHVAMAREANQPKYLSQLPTGLRSSSDLRLPDCDETGGNVSCDDIALSDRDSEDSSMLHDTQCPPPNSLTHENASELLLGEENDRIMSQDDDDEDEQVFDEESKLEEDGDLSENLTWLRRYHANEQHAQGLTGRLWRTIRTSISTMQESSSGAGAHSFSSASGNRKASIREKQHQDILMALSERELERQKEEYQDHQLQQQFTNLPKLPPIHTSRSDKIPKPSSKQHEVSEVVLTNESTAAETRSQSSSATSSRRPTNEMNMGAQDVMNTTAPSQHASNTSSNNNNSNNKGYQSVSPRLLPPMISTMLSGGSNSNLTAQSQEQSVNSTARLPRSAQKYGGNNGGHTTESLYHSPGVLLAYSR